MSDPAQILGSTWAANILGIGTTQSAQDPEVSGHSRLRRIRARRHWYKKYEKQSVQPRDLQMMGMLLPLGIERGKEFKPDAPTVAQLKAAAANGTLG